MGLRTGPPNGHPKWGGRIKGTPNILTQDFLSILGKLKCNPIEGMARIAVNPNYPIELRARMYAELAQYVVPKRKAIEHSGIGPNQLTIVVQRLDKEIPESSTTWRGDSGIIESADASHLK